MSPPRSAPASLAASSRQASLSALIRRPAASHRTCTNPAAACRRPAAPPQQLELPVWATMVECHYVAMTRDGVSTTLAVPLSVLAKYDKAMHLFGILTKERWQLPVLTAVRWSGYVAAEREVHTAELLFVRDGLGPLRRRPGPVPGKVGARSALN